MQLLSMLEEWSSQEFTVSLSLYLSCQRQQLSREIPYFSYFDREQVYSRFNERPNRRRIPTQGELKPAKNASKIE